jgi:hypothetical protein
VRIRCGDIRGVAYRGGTTAAAVTAARASAVGGAAAPPKQQQAPSQWGPASGAGEDGASLRDSVAVHQTALISASSIRPWPTACAAARAGCNADAATASSASQAPKRVIAPIGGIVAVGLDRSATRIRCRNAT